nr:hypothetical protein [Tanacetum cinerariifolium]
MVDVVRGDVVSCDSDGVMVMMETKARVMKVVVSRSGRSEVDLRIYNFVVVADGDGGRGGQRFDLSQLHPDAMTKKIAKASLFACDSVSTLQLDKLIDERVLKYGASRMKEKEGQAIKKIERRLQDSEMQIQKSLITEGATIEACLVTKGATLEACLVNKGIEVNDNAGVMESSGTKSKRAV